MGRAFFGSGFFPPSTPPPADYTDLLAWFADDDSALSAWVAGWIAFGTSAEAEELLAELETFESPDAALATLRDRPAILGGDFRPEFDRPFYDQDITVVTGAEFPGAIDLGTGF